MDKYIVEIEGKNTCTYHDGEKCLAFHVESDSGKAVICTKIPLTPYTEPDLEQIRKEAYENGYENGFIAGHLKAEKSGQSFYEDGHQRGLADAWEAARKIVLPGDVSGIYLADLEEIFDRSSLQDVIKDYSASEAIEKIRQYEQEKDRQVRIEYNFDEIKDVLETTAKECNVSLDEIAEVLAKMKES